MNHSGFISQKSLKMKNLLIALTFVPFCYPCSLLAQSQNKETSTTIKQVIQSKYMAFIGYGTGMNGKTFSLGVTYMNPKNQGITASFLTNDHPTKKLPTHINTLGNSDAASLKLNELKMINVAFVKLYPTSSKFIKLGFESGLDLYNYSYNAFTYKNNGSESGASVVGKYFINRKVVNSIGLSLKMKINFPLTKFVGMEVTPGINFNKHAPLIGIQAKINIGLVR